MMTNMQMELVTGTLSVVTKPEGATIILNGQAQAKKTPASFNLPPGDYRLQVVYGNLKSEEIPVKIRDGAISQRQFDLGVQ